MTGLYLYYCTWLPFIPVMAVHEHFWFHVTVKKCIFLCRRQYHMEQKLTSWTPLLNRTFMRRGYVPTFRNLDCLHSGTKGILLFFFKRPERYNQEVLSHPFICFPLPCMEGIVLICNIDLYCVIAIFNGHRWHVRWVIFLHIEQQLRQQK